MIRERIIGILTVILLVAGTVAIGAEVRNVVSVEAGYGYVLSARYLNPDGYAFGHHTRLGVGGGCTM